MESQIAARDRALFAGVDAQLEQHFLTPGQRLSPPGVGNVMLLMVCLMLGLAGVMGLVTDVAAAWSGKTSAAVLMGSGAIVAVWMTLILFQLVQGKNSGVVLLQYYLGMLGLCCLGGAAAWAAGMTGIATGALLLGARLAGRCSATGRRSTCMSPISARVGACLSNAVGRGKICAIPDKPSERKNL
ncbi:hypothetical protein QEP77_23885 [Serratia sp. B1]|nr:hypothetical protein QEP77_23885 [Serratia sp. B1]